MDTFYMHKTKFSRFLLCTELFVTGIINYVSLLLIQMWYKYKSPNACLKEYSSTSGSTTSYSLLKLEVLFCIKNLHLQSS